jgi:hypothetical protein
MSNHTELLTNAIAVTCEKRQRQNHFAPELVNKYNQNAVQFDWFITGVFVNNVELSDWCKALNFPLDAFRISTKPKKTKKDALASVISDFEQIISAAAPEWESQDETDCPEYFKMIASLKGDNQ